MDLSSFTFEVVSRHGTFVVTAPTCLRDKLSMRRWHVHRSKECVRGRDFYVFCNVIHPGRKRTTLFLHRFIWRETGVEEVAQIDHIDGQPLNNALDNLRDGSGSLNSFNRADEVVDLFPGTGAMGRAASPATGGER